MKNLIRSFSVSAALAGLALGGVHGPVQGYLIDSRVEAVRALNGIPGASMLSEPIALGKKISGGAFHSESGVGLVSAEGRLAAVRGLGSEPTLEPLEGGIAVPELFAIDRTGKTGVAISKGSGRLQFVSLGSGAEVSAPMELGEMAARVRALATVDAKRALLALGSPDGGIYLAHRGGALEKVAPADDVTALAALPDGSGAAFADRASRQVLRTHGIHAGAAVSLLASERDGVMEPVGLSVVGQRAWVVDAGSQNILAIDLSSNLPDKGIELGALPSRALALDGGNTVVLTEVGDSPLLVLDTTGAPRVCFVPVAREEQ